MLSRPGALPDFNFLMAASSSSTVKSDDRLASAVAALESVVLLPVSLFMVCHALRLECVKSIDSTTSVHLALRTSSCNEDVIYKEEVSKAVKQMKCNRAYDGD